MIAIIDKLIEKRKLFGFAETYFLGNEYNEKKDMPNVFDIISKTKPELTKNLNQVFVLMSDNKLQVGEKIVDPIENFHTNLTTDVAIQSV